MNKWLYDYYFLYFDKYMLLVQTLMIFVLLLLFIFFSYMYIIDIVKRGSAYKHLLLLLPFQSDMENVATCLL